MLSGKGSETEFDDFHLGNSIGFHPLFPTGLKWKDISKWPSFGLGMVFIFYFFYFKQCISEMTDNGPFFEINTALGDCSYFFKQRCQSTVRNTSLLSPDLNSGQKVLCICYLKQCLVVSTLLCFKWTTVGGRRSVANFLHHCSFSLINIFPLLEPLLWDLHAVHLFRWLIRSHYISLPEAVN